MKKTKFQILTAAALLTGFWCSVKVPAYFSAHSLCRNFFFPGGNTTEITEEFPTITPTPMPGNPSYEKTVRVTSPSGGTNAGNVPCYVRIRLSFSHEDVGNGVSFTKMDRENWIYDAGDDYYYYRHVLEPGKKTTALFQGFSIDSSKVQTAQPEKRNEFSVYVYEESVQAEGFSDYESAWNYYKEPVLGTGEGTD